MYSSLPGQTTPQLIPRVSPLFIDAFLGQTSPQEVLQPLVYVVFWQVSLAMS